MIKNFKAIICALLVFAVCVSVAGCKAKQEDETTTTAPVSNSQTESELTSEPPTEQETQPTEETSDDESTTEETTNTSTTKKKKPDKDENDKSMSISVNEALDVLQNFYGKAYEVSATIREGNDQYFAVYDKNGNKYASVKVNLETADAAERIIESDVVNEYNLLA